LIKASYPLDRKSCAHYFKKKKKKKLTQLPPEVIEAISRLLNLQDKLVLITTCRRLFNVVSETNLYSKLDLFKHTEKMVEIIWKFTGSRYPGEQVKKLGFDITKIPRQLFFHLGTIFPSIIKVRTCKYGTRKVIFQDYTKDPMLYWSDELQKLNLMCDWPEALPILKTATFPRLTNLRLSRPYDFDDKKEGFDISYFLPVFRNVSSLKKTHFGRMCA
jgi:hypothetical protein